MSFINFCHILSLSISNIFLVFFWNILTIRQLKHCSTYFCSSFHNFRHLASSTISINSSSLLWKYLGNQPAQLFLQTRPLFFTRIFKSIRLNFKFHSQYLWRVQIWYLVKRSSYRLAVCRYWHSFIHIRVDAGLVEVPILGNGGRKLQHTTET